MGSDCPTILSRSSSLTEVGGDAAIYFDPRSKVEIKDAIEKVIYDDDQREKLINLGRIQKKKFGWDKTANSTIEVYKSIV